MKYIDVHHHMLPEFLKQKLEDLGISQAGGMDLPVWTPDSSLKVMDDNGIQKSILSVSCPGVYFGDSGEATELARQSNEYASDLKGNSERFGYFATVPQTLIDESIIEIRHAFDVGHADGVTLLSSVDGKYLGNPLYDPLMEELHNRSAVVFVHPNLPKITDLIELEMPGFMMEFVFDTTRAVANLIASGVMERYSNIRFVLAHAGGTVPYLAWRLSLGDFVLDMENKFPKGTMHYLKQFYFDTALSPSPQMLGSLRELIGVDRILFGSDFPFAPDLLVHVETQDFCALNLSASERNQIGFRNAESLFT